MVLAWQDMVYNTALGIVQHTADAEDITQEVFIQVHQSIKGFKGESKLSTWLYRITVSKCLDHERRKKRKKRFAFIRGLFNDTTGAEVDIPDFVHPGVLLDNREKAGILFDAIAKLPEKQRIAFTLNKVEGLSHQEIGEVMHTSVSSVESLLHRARNNLRKELEDFYKQME